MTRTRTARLAAALLLLVIFCALAPTPAFAQGCAMCYKTTDQQNARAARSLNIAILALLSPALLMFGGVFFLAFRRRDMNNTKDQCE